MAGAYVFQIYVFQLRKNPGKKLIEKVTLPEIEPGPLAERQYCYPLITSVLLTL